MPGEPQNIYDDPRFFAGYSQLDRFGQPFGSAMEHGPFLRMAGDVAGLHVLDLGCGAGQLAHRLAADGAASVIAIDPSAQMLAVANEHWQHAAVTYKQLSMEDAFFANSSFDLVVSSLAFHYVENYEGLLQRVAAWLKTNGRLVFSTEHPIYAARSNDDGWAPDGTGWIVDDYAREGLRERQWFIAGVRRYHRTMATLLNGLSHAGFRIDEVYESAPDEAWQAAHPEHAEELRRPMFLLVNATKNSQS